jgi:hypothetical protein
MLPSGLFDNFRKKGRAEQNKRVLDFDVTISTVTGQFGKPFRRTGVLERDSTRLPGTSFFSVRVVTRR